MTITSELRTVVADLEGTRNRFSAIITGLNDTILELKVTNAELRSHIQALADRATEDRVTMGLLINDVNALKSWRSRIQGQIAAAYFLIGVVSAAGTIYAATRH